MLDDYDGFLSERSATLQEEAMNLVAPQRKRPRMPIWNAQLPNSWGICLMRLMQRIQSSMTK